MTHALRMNARDKRPMKRKMNVEGDQMVMLLNGISKDTAILCCTRVCVSSNGLSFEFQQQQLKQRR